MRQKLEIDSLQDRMTKGHQAALKKNKDIDAAERVREREDVEICVESSDGRARTRNQLLQQRRERAISSTLKHVKTFRGGIHGGKGLPTFYQNPAAKVDTTQLTIEWYKPSNQSETARAGECVTKNIDGSAIKVLKPKKTTTDQIKANRLVRLRNKELLPSCKKVTDKITPGDMSLSKVVDKVSKQQPKFLSRFSTNALFYRSELHKDRDRMRAARPAHD
mmetsp:Transcript_34056/g.42034  ORF Transcript_34056/g.42034 Transcript_34056/m.42034 type:complete len:220 (+) Transcript_34056:1096-1755(+)